MSHLSSPGSWFKSGSAVIVSGVPCFHLNGAPSVATTFFATYIHLTADRINLTLPIRGQVYPA